MCLLYSSRKRGYYRKISIISYFQKRRVKTCYQLYFLSVTTLWLEILITYKPIEVGINVSFYEQFVFNALDKILSGAKVSSLRVFCLLQPSFISEAAVIMEKFASTLFLIPLTLEGLALETMKTSLNLSEFNRSKYSM